MASIPDAPLAALSLLLFPVLLPPPLLLRLVSLAPVSWSRLLVLPGMLTRRFASAAIGDLGDAGG